MNAPSIARRFVIVGVIASFAAIGGTSLIPDEAPSASARSEVRYARLDPAAVLGGHDGLMPPAERDRPHRWDGERPHRRPSERRGEERRERDAERTRERS